jgi:hypothetical protein
MLLKIAFKSRLKPLATILKRLGAGCLVSKAIAWELS